MNGGGGDGAPPSNNGGEFLLSLLQQRPLTPHQLQQQQQQQQRQQLQQQLQRQQLQQLQQKQQQQQHVALVDPAVAAVGPTIPITPPQFLSPPRHLLGFPYQNPNFTPQTQRVLLSDDNLQKLGFLSNEVGGNTSDGSNSTIHNLLQQQQQKVMQVGGKMQFGSFSGSVEEGEVVGSFFDGFNRNNAKLELRENRAGGGSYYRSPLEARVGPPGFLNKPKGVGRGNGDYGYERREFERNVEGERGRFGEFERNARNERGSFGEFERNVNKEKGRFGEFERNVNKEKGRFGELGGRNGDMRLRSSDGGGASDELRLTEQLDRPGPPAGSNLHLALGSKVEESVFREVEVDEKGDGGDDGELDDLGGELVDSLLLDGESDSKKDNKQNRHQRDKVDSVSFMLDFFVLL